MTLARAVLAAAVVALPLAARAGVVIEAKGRGDGNQRFAIEGQKVRMDGRDGKRTIIFDAAAKKMTEVDRDKHVYNEVTQADMEQMNAMMRQAQEEHGAPKKGASAFALRYEKTGKTDSALGKSCDVYRVLHGSEKTHDSEICVAPFGTFGVEKSDFAPFRAFGDFAGQLGGGRRGPEQQTWADIPGVPLLGWDVEGGNRKETFRATKVEKRSVPASEFEVPAGFQKGPNFAEQMKLMQQQMGNTRQKGGGGAK